MAALTLEVMQGKLDDLKMQRDRALDTLHAVDGAIQLAQHLIEELKEPEKNVSDSSTSSPVEPGTQN